MKPVRPDDLIQAVNKVKKITEEQHQLPDLSNILNDLSKETFTKIPITTKNGIEYIPINDVIRLERDKNYCKVILQNGNQYLVKKSLTEYENLLCKDEFNFMRVHQSHIVNLKHILRYTREGTGTIITKDESKIPLSKQKRDVFMKWLDIKAL